MQGAHDADSPIPTKFPLSDAVVPVASVASCRGVWAAGSLLEEKEYVSFDAG